MRIHCCYSEPHRILFERYFRPSVPPDLEICSTLLPLGGSGDFLSREYMQCLRHKVGLIKESVRRSPGETLLWSDVDIRFYRPVAPELEELLAASGKSMLYQKEDRSSRETSGGFFVCRAHEGVVALFDQVQALLDERPEWHDQDAVNHLIVQGDFTDFAYLPFTYSARTHGWPPPRDARIYHANYTKGADAVGQKIRQLAEADAAIRGSRLQRAMSMVRFGRELGPLQLARAAWRRLDRFGCPK